MNADHQTSIFKGAFLTVSMRWTDRLIGLVSTLILARLLVPADFGIIAMSSLTIGLLDVLLDLGVNVALVKNREATQAHFDTAWTLRIMQTCVTAMIVMIAAPYAGEYFDDPRVVPVLRVMSFALILSGLENIGIVDFQKQMQFGLEFRFLFLKRFAGFLTTITLAWFLRSYWAMVIGALSGRMLGVILSYFLHPMRPRLSLAKFGEIFAVSQWMLVRGIGQYLDMNLHRMLVGNRANTATMGGYSLADEISNMPTTELLAPLNRVLFPAFVHAKGQAGELKKLFLLAQGVQSLVGIPAGTGLAMVAHEAVLVLLGDKWLLAVSFIQILALANIATAIATSGNYVMITLGKVREVALLTWINVAVFASGAFLIIEETAVIDLAWMRLTTVVLGLFLTLSLLMRNMRDLQLGDVARTVARPLLGAIAMSGAISLLPGVPEVPALTALVLKISTGGTVYVTIVLFLWWLAGKPQGAESYLLGKSTHVFERIRRRRTT